MAVSVRHKIHVNVRAADNDPASRKPTRSSKSGNATAKNVASSQAKTKVAMWKLSVRTTAATTQF